MWWLRKKTVPSWLSKLWPDFHAFRMNSCMSSTETPQSEWHMLTDIFYMKRYYDLYNENIINATFDWCIMVMLSRCVKFFISPTQHAYSPPMHVSRRHGYSSYLRCRSHVWARQSKSGLRRFPARLRPYPLECFPSLPVLVTRRLSVADATYKPAVIKVFDLPSLPRRDTHFQTSKQRYCHRDQWVKERPEPQTDRGEIEQGGSRDEEGWRGTAGKLVKSKSEEYRPDGISWRTCSNTSIRSHQKAQLFPC